MTHGPDHGPGPWAGPWGRGHGPDHGAMPGTAPGTGSCPDLPHGSCPMAPCSRSKAWRGIIGPRRPHIRHRAAGTHGVSELSYLPSTSAYASLASCLVPPGLLPLPFSPFKGLKDLCLYVLKTLCFALFSTHLSGPSFEAKWPLQGIPKWRKNMA